MAWLNTATSTARAPDYAVLEQGRADLHELRAQLKRHIWQVLNETPGVVAGDSISWQVVPHIVVDVLGEVMAEVWEPLIAYDARTEVPAAKHQIDVLRVRLDVLEAMSCSDVPKC
jgi:hypothetical protein